MIHRKLAEDNPAVTDFRSRLANCHGGIAAMQSDTGQSAEALQSYRDALAIQRKLCEGNPADTEFRSHLADTHINIGVTQLEAGQTVEALASYRECVGDLSERPGIIPPPPTSAARWL